MRVEIAIPFPGGVTRKEKREIPNVLAKARKWLRAKERTGRPQKSNEDLIIAVYLGVVLACRVNQGLINRQEAKLKLAELICLGINPDQVCRTFLYMTHCKVSFDWIDMSFQSKTLQKYLPELISEKFRREPQKYFDRVSTPENN